MKQSHMWSTNRVNHYLRSTVERQHEYRKLGLMSDAAIPASDSAVSEPEAIATGCALATTISM
jgi:hypothetical protein